jgi:plastocyanin
MPTRYPRAWPCRERWKLLASLAVLLVPVAYAIGAAERVSAKQHVVTIEGLQFKPDTLNVRVGDTIVWNNKDLVPHTVTALDKSFQSLTIAPDSSWTYKPDKAGTFAYVCSFHPIMKATLIVKP